MLAKAYREKLEYDPQKEFPHFSYASGKFAVDACAMLSQLFRAVELWPEGKAVIGSYVCGGADGQWHDAFDVGGAGRSAKRTPLADHSAAMKLGFAAFRRAKYGKDDVDVHIPTKDELVDSTRTFYAIYGSTLCSDYREFEGRATNKLRLRLANAIKKICDYADSQNEPAVISISLGSHNGPHDGTGSLASVYAQYGGSHANHIIVNAAGNEAGYGDYYGYVYSGGEATSSKPFSTVINGYAGNTKNQQYYGYDIFYARTAGRQVACKLHVVNTSTNQVVWTSNAITSSTSSVSGITTYFSSSPTVTITRNSYNNKYYVELYTNCSKKSAYTNSNYALAISVYPTSGTCM